MPRVHDPMNRNCARNNTTCLVYHSDGVCPDAGKIGQCSCPQTIQEDRNGHKIGFYGELVYDERCRDGECEAPPEKQDWETRFKKNFCNKKDRDWKTDGPTGNVMVNHNDVIDFIRTLLQESKEDGRREERHKIYGDIDPLESRKIENQIVIEQARLEVIEKIEEYIEHHYDHKHGNIHYDGLKQFINAIKTNSK